MGLQNELNCHGVGLLNWTCRTAIAERAINYKWSNYV